MLSDMTGWDYPIWKKKREDPVRVCLALERCDTTSVETEF